MTLAETAQDGISPQPGPRAPAHPASRATHRWVRVILLHPLLTLVSVVLVNVFANRLSSTPFEILLVIAAFSGFTATVAMARRTPDLRAGERWALAAAGLACNVFANYAAVFVSLLFIVSSVCGGLYTCLIQ